MGFLFSAFDAERILWESEGKPDHRGEHVGHAIARHVHITRDDLHRRMHTERANKAGVPVYTAFTSVTDQAGAVAEAINAPQSAAIMNRFFHPDRVLPGERRQLADVVLTNAIAVRLATGGDGPAMRAASFVTVRLSKCPGRHRDMHIETAFATFAPLSLGELVDSV